MDSSSQLEVDKSSSSSCSTGSVLSFPTSLHPQLGALKRLEDQFRCRICYDLFTEPTSTPCAHNFCALCIRKYLNFKNQCPECYEPVRDSELRPNRLAKEVLRLLAQDLLPEVKSKAISGKIEFRKKDSSTPAKSEPNTPKRDVPFKKAASKTPAIQEKPPKSPTFRSKNDGSRLSSQSTSALTQPRPGPSPFLPSSQTKATEERVPCPVCSVDVPKANINFHLDRCLNGESNPSEAKPAAVRNGMKPIQKVVYHLMKDADLRKMLKEAGLDAKGDKATLEKRHKRFSALWNSQCQMEEPLSKMQISMMARKEEQAEKLASSNNASTSSASTMMLSAASTSKTRLDPETAEANAKTYIHENKKTFKDLIAEIKNRGKSKVTESSKTLAPVVEEPPVLKTQSPDDDISDISDTDSISLLVDQVFEQDMELETGIDVDKSVDMFNTSDLSVVQPVKETQASQVLRRKVTALRANALTVPRSSTPAKTRKTRVAKKKNETGSKKKVEGDMGDFKVGSAVYITPKRKSSTELSEDSKRFRQNSIVSSMSKNRPEGGGVKKKEPCPVCGVDVPTRYMSSHVERCLTQSENAKTRNQTKKQKSRKKSKAEEEEDDEEPPEDFGDFEVDNEGGVDEDEEEDEEFDVEKGLSSQEMKGVEPRSRIERRAKVEATKKVKEVDEEEEKETDQELQPPTKDAEKEPEPTTEEINSDPGPVIPDEGEKEEDENKSDEGAAMMAQENENFEPFSQPAGDPCSPLKLLQNCDSPKERAEIKGKMTLRGKGGKKTKKTAASRKLAQLQVVEIV